ncbi:MAG TPA: hypothetical protein H9671_01305 [Firmicutes bacterium]|nr:hypothetical protein [Bacillota bacterium]
MKDDLYTLTKYAEDSIRQTVHRLHLNFDSNSLNVEMKNGEALVTAESYGSTVQEADVQREVAAVLAEVNRDLPDDSYLTLFGSNISYFYSSSVCECAVAITIACYL